MFLKNGYQKKKFAGFPMENRPIDIEMKDDPTQPEAAVEFI